MKQGVFVVLLILIMLPLIALPILASIYDGRDCPTMVVYDVDSPNGDGRFTIPSAGVDVVYTHAHGGIACCYMGLWNGGRVVVEAEDLPAVSIDDKAYVKQEYGNMVLECVEIMDCIVIGGNLFSTSGIVRHGGDVLLCVDTGRWAVVRVYRFTML